MKEKYLLKAVIAGVIVVLVLLILFGIFGIVKFLKDGRAVLVVTEKREYAVGEGLRLNIRNNFKKAVCFSSCYPYYFEYLVNNKWEEYEYLTCGENDLAGNCINPGEVKGFELFIPAFKEKGSRHRLSIPVCLGCSESEKFSTQKKFYSNEFVIK